MYYSYRRKLFFPDFPVGIFWLNKVCMSYNVSKRYLSNNCIFDLKRVGCVVRPESYNEQGHHPAAYIHIAAAGPSCFTY